MKGPLDWVNAHVVLVTEGGKQFYAACVSLCPLVKAESCGKLHRYLYSSGET